MKLNINFCVKLLLREEEFWLEVEITLTKFFKALKNVTCRTLKMNFEKLILEREMSTTIYVQTNIQLCVPDQYVSQMLNNSGKT